MSCSFLYFHLGPPAWITCSDSYIYLEPPGYLGYDFVGPRERDGKGLPGQVSALTQDSCSLPFRQHLRARTPKNLCSPDLCKCVKPKREKSEAVLREAWVTPAGQCGPDLLLGSAPMISALGKETTTTHRRSYRLVTSLHSTHTQKVPARGLRHLDQFYQPWHY